MTTQLPHDGEAERALLGSILLDPELINKVKVEPADFYLGENRAAFEAMKRLRKSGRAIDFLTVSIELDKKEDSYLTGLVSSTFTSLHAEAYAGIIQDAAKRRNIILVASQLATAAYNDDENLPEKISEAITKLANNAAGDLRSDHWNSALSELYDRVEKAFNNPRKNDVWGTRTGLSGWDKITGGLHPGEVIIVTGDTGVGKSQFVNQVGIGAADPSIGNSPGVIYSLEMGGIQLARRAVSAASKVQTRTMMTGRLGDEDWENFTHAIEKFSGFPVYLSDASGWTTTTMRADLARLKSEAGVKWAVVDYLELLKDQYGQSDTERTKHISGQLKALAKDLNISLLVVQSQNKAGINGLQKGSASLAGSVKIVYDADQVWTLKKLEGNQVRLQAEKLREGDGMADFLELVRLPGFPAFGEKAYG